MALFPAIFIDDLRLQADIVQVDPGLRAAQAGGRELQGALSVSRGEDAVVPRQPGEGLLPLLRLRRRRRRLQVPRAAREGRLPRTPCGCWRGASAWPLPEPVPTPTRADARGARSAAQAARGRARLLQGAAGRARGRAGAARSSSGRAASHDRRSSGIGYAPSRGRPRRTRCWRQGSRFRCCSRSGLVVRARERRGGGSVPPPADVSDRPRHRVGGRVRRAGAGAEQQPKYLNSPETPIYTKGRTLYGLHLTKEAIRKLRYAVLVEGYFDFAQALPGRHPDRSWPRAARP